MDKLNETQIALILKEYVEYVPIKHSSDILKPKYKFDYKITNWVVIKDKKGNNIHWINSKKEKLNIGERDDTISKEKER